MADVKEITSADGNVYKGEYNADGMPHGKGHLTMSNGDIYEGYLKEGQRHGKGKMAMHNG